MHSPCLRCKANSFRSRVGADIIRPRRAIPDAHHFRRIRKLQSSAVGRPPVGRRVSLRRGGGAQVPALHSVLDDPVVGVGVLDDPAGCAYHHDIPGRIRTAPRVGAIHESPAQDALAVFTMQGEFVPFPRRGGYHPPAQSHPGCASFSAHSQTRSSAVGRVACARL